MIDLRYRRQTPKGVQCRTQQPCCVSLYLLMKIKETKFSFQRKEEKKRKEKKKQLPRSLSLCKKWPGFLRNPTPPYGGDHNVIYSIYMLVMQC